MKNISILTENILFAIQDKEAEEYYFRLRDLGFTELDAEREALEWLKVLFILRSVMPTAMLLHQCYKLEVTEDLVSFIRKRHECTFGGEMRILLIDGSNLHEAAKSIDLSIDYSKLLSLMREDEDKFRAYYFTALPNRSVQSQLHKLSDWLGYNGYTVVKKETKEYRLPNGEVRIKGNMDVEIAVYAMRLCKIASKIYLFSGDGDFTSLVAEMQQISSAEVTCVSSKSFISGDLRKQCDNFIALESIADAIRQGV